MIGFTIIKVVEQNISWIFDRAQWVGGLDIVRRSECLVYGYLAMRMSRNRDTHLIRLNVWSMLATHDLDKI